jgi:hypothetical protein
MESEIGKEDEIHIHLSDKFLDLRDDGYFHFEFRRLFFSIRQWVVQFSEYSVTGTSRRIMSEIGDVDVSFRLKNSVFDGSDVEIILTDRVKRRDVLIAVTTAMISEFIFMKYFFVLDRENGRRLKALEEILMVAGEFNLCYLDWFCGLKRRV